MSKEENRKSDEEVIKPKDLLRSMSYDKWDHPIVIKAFNLMGYLNKWLRSCYAKECCPHAHISVADFGLVVMVNDLVMWDSENDDESELTLDYCKSRYKGYAKELMVPFD